MKIGILEMTESSRLQVRVNPNASSSTFQGWLDQEILSVRIQAPAVEGKANKALLTFLAKALGLRRRELTITRGERGRNKVIEVPLSKKELHNRINQQLM